MNELNINNDYKIWLSGLKSTIQQRQIKAAIAVNVELIKLYWELGKQIVEKQETAKWGTSFINQLSRDLKNEFSDMKGFSYDNLRYMKSFYLFYFSKSEQPVPILENLDSELFVSHLAHENIILNQLTQIPWGHHVLILKKLKNREHSLFYIQQTIENNWSRAVLEYQIETKLHSRQGNAITNFTNTLPKTDSDLAHQLLKDPYNFEFLTLDKTAKEKDLEKELINNISKFILELGKGFAYLGNQFLLKVGNKEYKLDLLFYHILLKRYVVIELKMQEFQPEFVGKLNFYISAINEIVKTNSDNDTIGILLCKTKDNFEVEFALKDVNKPIGVSEFSYSELSDELKNALPSPQELKNQLNFPK